MDELHAIKDRSLPTRERGLKVCFIRIYKDATEVAPYAGAWIERGIGTVDHPLADKRRSLRGSVD